MDSLPIYDSFPNSCYIGKEIPRDKFFALGQIAKRAGEEFRFACSSIRVMYILRPEFTGIIPTQSKTADYPEIHVIEAKVVTRQFGWQEEQGWARTIFQALPYPILLIMRTNLHVQYFTALFHKSPVKNGKNTVDEIHNSGWIKIDDGLWLSKILASEIKADARICDIYKNWHDFIDRYRKQIQNMLYNGENDEDMTEYFAEVEKSKEWLIQETRDGAIIPEDWYYEYGLKPPLDNVESDAERYEDESD